MRIAITLGCPRGIGPEVARAALRGALPGVALTIVAPPGLLDLPDLAAHYAPPRVSPTDHLGFQAAALESLVALAASGEVDAIVTGPIRKAALDLLGDYPGQTEYCHAHLAVDDEPPLMCFAGGPFVLGLATVHLALRDVPDALTQALLESRALRLLDVAARLRPKPRLAVLGLNPHAGEDGRLGDEERTVFAPVLERLRAAGHDVVGPLPADGFFSRGDGFDAVLAAFHDQGLAPYKILSRGRGVNFTAGLRVPRTSPDHGTADGIAGLGVADAGSMRAAIELAITLAGGSVAG